MNNQRRSFFICATMMFASVAGAQVQTDTERFQRQLEQIRRDTRLLVNSAVPADQRSLFDYGMYTSFNFLSFDDSEGHNRTLRQYDLTGYAQLNMDGVHEVFLRGRGSYRDFNNGDRFDTDGNGFDGRIERAYYRFDLARYLAGTRGSQTDGDFSIKLGRDLDFWGNGLVFNTELDGAVMDLSLGPASLEILAGRTPSDTVDIDSGRPNFDDHTNRFFYGAMLSTHVGEHRPYVYFLGQRDHNSDDQSTTQIGGTDITTDFEYESHYFGLGSNGALTDRLAYGIEFAIEGGDTLSNSFDISNSGTVSQANQSRDHIEAWALDGQLDYLIGDAHRTRVGGEVILASGDSDRRSATSTLGGNRPGSADHAFNAFGLLNTGLAFAPSVSNIVILRGGVSTFPFLDIRPLKRMQVGGDLFLFGKLDKDAPIDESTSADFLLGFEPDLYVNWQLTSDVSLALRYGAFVPGPAVDSDGKIRQFVYAGVTFAF